MMNLVSKSWSRLLVVLTLGIATANPVPPPVFDINHATLIEADAGKSQHNQWSSSRREELNAISPAHTIPKNVQQI